MKTSVPQSAWVALRSSQSRKKKLVTEKRSIWLYTDTTESGYSQSSILGIVGQDGGSHHYLHSHGILSFPASYMEDVMLSDLNHHRTTETRGLFLYMQDKSLAELLSLHDSVLWCLSITRHISLTEHSIFHVSIQFLLITYLLSCSLFNMLFYTHLRNQNI